jgi:hypothetical protein
VPPTLPALTPLFFALHFLVGLTPSDKIWSRMASSPTDLIRRHAASCNSYIVQYYKKKENNDKLRDFYFVIEYRVINSKQNKNSCNTVST